MEESDPDLALMVVLASVKAAQLRPGKGLAHFATVGVGVAAAAVLEGVRNMVGESVTELVVEGEGLRSTIAEAVEARGASEAEPLIVAKGVNSRSENTVAVVAEEVVQQGVDCLRQGPDGCTVGMAVEHWDDVESECREGAEDGTVVVVGSVVDIAVAVAVDKIADEGGAAAVVVGVALVAVEAGYCETEDTFEVETEVVVSEVQVVCGETGEASGVETEKTSAGSPEWERVRNPARLAARRPG